MKSGLECTPIEAGVEFRLFTKGVLANKSIQVDEWIQNASPASLVGASQLISWVEEGVATASKSAVVVPHKVVANLKLPSAAALGLPQVVPFILDLQHQGTLDQPEFRFKATWLAPTGQTIPGLQQLGSMLRVGTKRYRVPQPLFDLIEAAAAFNAVPVDDIDERFRAWGYMRSFLPDESDRSIRVDGYLASTRIAHATRFSLAFQSGSQGFNFDPVLFGASQGADSDADVLESVRELDGLLPPFQQRAFAQKRFRTYPECRPRYALDQGWYLVIDEPARRALTVVRRLQDAHSDVRREFVRNPRAFLKQALGNEMDEGDLEALFVETAEYSARVQDVGLWRPRTLPWVQTSGEPWLPETFGFQIGEERVTVTPTDAAALRDEIASAIAAGEASVPWRGMAVPATEQLQRALDAAAPAAKPSRAAPLQPEQPSATGEHEPRQQFVLEIVDNLSALGFQRWRLDRTLRPEPGVPATLATSLKAHQKEGLQWLQDAWASGQTGVLLADDMGLGKTLQALAFLAWLREAIQNRVLPRRPVLIVAPTGLLQNWKNEHNQHLREPGLGDVTEAYGKGLSSLRESRGREIETGKPTLNYERLAQADWILTTYETLRDYQHSFCTIRYAAVVFDEMQKIKTPGTVMTHAAKALHADFVVGLTGTPVENRLADLWCLVDTMQPGLLKDLASFSRQYEQETSAEELKTLKAALNEPTPTAPSLMMRRMKADRLKGLPEKSEHVLRLTMPAVQAAAYEQAVEDARANPDGSKMLEALHRLRSISLHPFGPETADDNYAAASARFILALKALDDIEAKGEKVLLFLESQEMQPFVAGLLQKRYRLKSLPMIINGAVAGKVRQERVDAFQQAERGFDAMILSPRAGGVGLTLTNANHVIHLSRWWNPAVEDQCTDRVYRIGQKRDVHVYYPQAVHPEFEEQSFDRRLHGLLERKRKLSRELLMPVMSPDDTKDLFRDTVDRAGGTKFDLADIDAMEPLQFENWVMSKLRDGGYEARRTQRSHDGGADCIAHHRATGRPMIVQCKHTQTGSRAPDEAIFDLERAQQAYELKNPALVAITNADSFGKSAEGRAKAANIQLVCRGALARWPRCVNQL